MGVLSAVVATIMIAVAALTASVKNSITVESTSSRATMMINLVTASKSGLYLAKEALSNDMIWNDCYQADRNCNQVDEHGFYILHSETLEKDLEDYKVGKASVTVKIKPEDADTVWVLSTAKQHGTTYSILAQFKRTAYMFDKIPLVYAGLSSSIFGGQVCSYYWDGNRIVGVTNPYLSIYVDNKFWWSTKFVIPRHPAGPNPKLIRLFVNKKKTLHGDCPDDGVCIDGYRVIDEVYSTSNIYLRYGAHVKLAYANGRVYTYWFSGADEKVEHGNYQYPEFNRNIEDNTITGYSTSWRDNVVCRRGTITLPAGSYRDLYLYNGCTVVLTGKQYTFRKIVAHNRSTIKVTQPNTIVNAKTVRTYNRSTLLFTPDNPQKDYMILKAEEVDMYNRSNIECTHPQACLIDTNDLDMHYKNTVVSTVLARNKAYINRGTVIGNMFAETIVTKYATFCNVVTKEGHQIVGVPHSFYDVAVLNNSLPLSVALRTAVLAVCSDVEKCLSRLGSVPNP